MLRAPQTAVRFNSDCRGFSVVLRALFLIICCVGCGPPSPEDAARDRLTKMGVQIQETHIQTPYANIPAAETGHLFVRVPFNRGAGMETAWGDEEFKKAVPDLRKLSDFDYLMLQLTRISDESMSDVASLQQLRHLHLGFTRVTDEGIAELEPLHQLEGLYAENSKTITGRGLASLKSAPLRKLSLRDTVATDDSLEVLSNFTALEHLDLGLNHRVGDGALIVVGKLPKLRTLLLDRTGITDEGLRELQGASRLERLVISMNPQIGESELRKLCRLPKLSFLDVSGTGIKKPTVEMLRTEFPHLKIGRSFGAHGTFP